jgi:hypothetical protein
MTSGSELERALRVVQSRLISLRIAMADAITNTDPEQRRLSGRRRMTEQLEMLEAARTALHLGVRYRAVEHWCRRRRSENWKRTGGSSRARTRL